MPTVLEQVKDELDNAGVKDITIATPDKIRVEHVEEPGSSTEFKMKRKKVSVTLKFPFKPPYIPDDMEEDTVADELAELYDDVRAANPKMNIPEKAKVENRHFVIELEDAGTSAKEVEDELGPFVERTSQIMSILFKRLGTVGHSCHDCGGCEGDED